MADRTFWHWARLLAILLMAVPAASGCSVLHRLDAMNAELRYANRQLDEANQNLSQGNASLDELAKISQTMDKRLATVEKLAKRFGAAGQIEIDPNESVARIDAVGVKRPPPLRHAEIARPAIGLSD